MPQIPAAIPTQAFELIRNRIAEILVDELPAQATFAGDPKINATVYVERSVMFDLTEMPAVNVSVSRTAYSEQTQRNTDGEHTFTIDVHTSAKSTSSVRGDSLAAFRLQKLLGVCRGILEDSRYKTLGFAPPFIESRKVTSIEYAQPTEGDGTSSVQGRITFIVRAPDRNGVVTPELIAGYDTQVKLGLTEKGYIFTGDNIPVPPIVGAEISVNSTFYIDAEAGDEVDIPVIDSAGNAVGDVTAATNVTISDSEITLKDTGGNVLDTVSVLAEGSDDIIAPDATVTVNTTPFGTAPSGGSLDVPVVNGGSNPVGTIQAGQVVISNNATFINGVQVTDQEAEIDANIAVELDGNPSGSWNAMTQTWEVNSSPCAAANLEINGVQQETIASGATFNLIATLDGVAGGSYNAGTNTLSFASNTGWIRPSEWIAIPDLTSADERFYGVLAVFEGEYNQLAVKITTTAANIDWGDGSSVVSNGLVQTHAYDYTTLAGAVSVWPDGRNYKQVLVDITRVGPAITLMEWRNPATVCPRGNNNFIDVIFSLPSVVTLRMSLAALSGARGMPLLERLRIRDTGTLTAVEFIGLTGLQAMELPTLKGNMPNNLFPDQQVIELADLTINGNNAQGMFRGSRIRKVGNVVGNSLTGAVGSATIFADCPVLEEVGTLTMNAATSLQALFGSSSGSPRLRKVGLITAPNVTNLDSSFIHCYSLSEVVFSDCALVTSVASTFLNCVSLTNCVMPNLTRGVVFSTTNMGNYGMNNFANSIGTATGAQTITVTGTPFGALLTALDATALAIRLVMTGKGYTVAN